MFEDRNKLKIVTRTMLLTEVLDASIVLDLENKFFHVVNADFEWDSYKLDEVEVYANTTGTSLLIIDLACILIIVLRISTPLAHHVAGWLDQQVARWRVEELLS